jgi:hypothetical protein
MTDPCITYGIPILPGPALGLLNRVIDSVPATDALVMVALLKMPRRYRGPARIDRRIFPRKEVHAELHVARIDNSLDALKSPNLTLYLRDLSLGGMSAISPLPLQQGERLTLHFPRTETYGGWDAIGHVRRCVQSAMGYRVAVEFDPLPAA